jgi:GT2 family glycosyltransferase
VRTSIIILSYNKLDYTRECIDSIRRYTAPDSYELIVVDNNSIDDTPRWLASQADIQTILNPVNRGFPAGCNQGITAARGDNILLLNNDTVVTHRWLDNLIECLYGGDDVGAVGPVTNYASYHSTINAHYKSREELQAFARRYNSLRERPPEQRLKLIGFCMLIRRSVIDEIGLLDERFSPGHYEDDDYSLRIRRAGYRLMLCNDTFIHHYGSVSFKDDEQEHQRLGKVNAGKFQEKWGFNPDYYTYIRNDLVGCIDAPAERSMRVLEIGCGCGATLLSIRNRYPKARLYGVELNASAAEDASLVAEVSATNIEQTRLEYPSGFFDYIIFADVLEHLVDPWKTLVEMKRCLADTGQILASIPNVMHYSVIRELVNGFWTYQDAGILDRTHLRFFTAHEITRLFNEAGFPHVALKSLSPPAENKDLEFINQLVALSSKEMAPQYHAYQYLVRAGGR